MTTAIIKMYNELGHLIPAFHFANKLKAYGFSDVIFVADSQFETEIKRHGFSYEREMDYNNVDAHFRHGFGFVPKNIFQRYRHIFSRFRNSLTAKFVEHLRQMVSRYRPVVFFVDELHVNYVIGLYGAGVPVVTLSTYQYSYRDDDVPPPNSSLIPDESLTTQVSIRLQWMVVSLQRWYQQLALYLRYPGGDYYYRTLAKLVGYPFSNRVANNKYYWIDDKLLDKYVLSTPLIDFPRNHPSNVHYIGSCICANPEDNNFDWSDIDLNKPIVYCSLGTQTHKHRIICEKFLTKLLNIFVLLPNITLILSLGGLLSELHRISLPNNIVLIDRAPQVAVLKHANLMITHGGLGAVKECIRMGVPMLVYPVNLDVDQPGNAARIIYHGLGLRGNIRRDNESMIRSNILNVMNRNHYKQNATAFRENVISWENAEPLFKALRSTVEDIQQRPKQQADLLNAI